MPYQTIFEIGPIFHYVRNSRKTMDVWGSSFLFSYLMGRVANKIVELEKSKVEDVIKRPMLINDPLYKWISENKLPKEGIAAGSIPDQIFCVHQNKDLPENIKNEFQKILEELFKKCQSTLNTKYNSIISNNNQNNALIKSQLSDYFRLFFVTVEKKEEGNWEKLEKAIASRGRMFSFDSYKDENNQVGSKKEKCSLCGDYKSVLILKNSRRNNKDEHLCAVCTIKRGLLESYKDEIKLEKFHSTTSIAAKIVKKVLFANYETMKNDINNFAGIFIARNKVDEEMSAFDWQKLQDLQNLKDNIQSDEIIRYLPYQQYFSDDKISIDFRQKIKEKCEIKINEKVWINSGYYAIVSVDGDNTGKLFVNATPEKSAKISAAIAKYSSDAKFLIGDNGQLIYSGGEDILFFIHPVDVLRTIQRFSNKFYECLKPFSTAEQPLTISAGVYICPHKHPLKLALKGAEELLEKAKNINDKNTIYIKLVKGAGEVNESYFKIRKNDSEYALDDFDQLINDYTLKGIPRSFVYKLINDYDVYSEVLQDENQLLFYVKDTFLKTRQENLEFKESIKNLVIHSALKNSKNRFDFKQLIERLYLARFLTGGE